MKLIKKLLSYIIAVTMVLSLATLLGGNVHAEGTATEGNTTTYTLTLTGTAKGHTYEAYQVFKGDLSGDTLSNIQWGTGIDITKKDDKNHDLIQALKDDTTLNTKFGSVTDAASVAKALEGVASNSAEMDAFAQVVGKYLSTTSTSQSSSVNETETKITGLAAGYYLVKDADNSQNGRPDAYTKFIVQVVGNAEAKIKSGVPTVTKKVKDINDSEDSNIDDNAWQDSADHDIGDTVPYQITGTMPDNIANYTTYKYMFTDTMSKGLTYTAGKATIKIDGKTVTDSFTEHVTTGDNGTTVTWSCDNLKGINDPGDSNKKLSITPSTQVVVTYSAQLNENAVIGAAGNPNTVNLTYSNNPNKGGESDTGKTPDDKNIVFTYKTVVNKLDQDKKSLKGAAFKLEKIKSDGTSTVVNEFTAGDATTFEFTGLDDGNYKLTETTTPAGYNTITPIEFTISATHDTASDEPTLTELTVSKVTGEATFTADKTAGSLTTDVVNKKGSNLPSTGGMGTTLLYVAGGILVACAAAYVVLNKKRA